MLGFNVFFSGEYVCQVSAFKPTQIYHSVKIRGKNSLKLQYHKNFSNTHYIISYNQTLERACMYDNQITRCQIFQLFIINFNCFIFLEKYERKGYIDILKLKIFNISQHPVFCCLKQRSQSEEKKQ